MDARAEKEAQGAVSLQLQDVPLETAVRLLAEMAGLKPVRVGNTLFVTRKELAAEMRNDPDFAPPPGPVVTPVSSFSSSPINSVGGPTTFLNTVPVYGGYRPTTPPAPAPNPPDNGPGVTAPPAIAPSPATGTTTPPNPRLGEPDVQRNDDK